MKAIFITGAFGSGKSTLAKKLAESLKFPYVEGDELRWDNGKKRSDEEFSILQKQVITKYNYLIYDAGHLKHLTPLLKSVLVGVIFVDTPTEECHRRIWERDSKKHGNKILEGGEFYEDHAKFMNDVLNYNNTEKLYGRKKHEEFLKSVTCPVIKIDGTKPTEYNVELIISSMDNNLLIT